MAAASKEMRNPATCLTDDLILEILVRLPVKSLCRFKCVSKSWRDLICHPEHRKRLPQTLAGFFYHTYSSERFPELARHFINVTGRRPPLICPSLSFLPGYADIDILDCCNGLLLCRSRTPAGTVRYVVCNPATKEWAALPESSQSGEICKARLGFDPAVSPHFHVFEILGTLLDEVGDAFVDGLEVYSSNTREWVHRDSGWNNNVGFGNDRTTVFLNGSLHLLANGPQDVLAVVDTEGNKWRMIPVPNGSEDGSIGQSQGHLYYMNTFEEHDFKLTIYVLEDYATDEWIFKHSICTSKLLGMSMRFPLMYFWLITIHPECHLIFFVSDLDNTIRCYDMDHRKLHVVCNMGAKRNPWKQRCLPYVPLFSESSAAWN